MSVDPVSLDYGAVRLGTPANQTEQTLTLTNTATFPIQVVSECVVTQPDVDFTIPTACPVMIAAGDTRALTVRFAPQARGRRTATLTIDYQVLSDPVQPGTLSVPLSGSGIGPVMEVSIVPAAEQPLDFGAALVETASATTYTIVVENTGDDILNARLTESGANPGDWTYDSENIFAVEPLATREIVATFTPAALGARSATVSIADVDGLSPEPGPVDIAMIGAGEEAQSGIGVTPTALNFGVVDIETPEPVSRTVTVTNPGTQDLVISAMTLEDLSGAPYEGTSFQVPTPAPLTVAPGGEGVIEVQYLPSAESAGDYAVLALATNVVDIPEVQVTLSGQGVNRNIDVSRLTLSFGPTYRNPARPPLGVVDVQNAGSIPIQLGGAVIEGQEPGVGSFTVLGDLDGSLGPGEIRSVGVRFHPRAASDGLAAELLILGAEGGEPIVRVALSGSGILPPLSATHDVVQWGSIAVGQERTLPGGGPLIVRNESEEETFLVQEVRVNDDQGEPLDGVRVTGFTEPVALPPGRELLLEVAFAPERGGVYDGAIEVLIEPDPEPVVVVSFSGAAVATDARGGGGCAAAGDWPGPAGWLAAACALALALRTGWRRRRRGRGVVAGALLCACFGSSAPASAQVQGGEDVDLASFRPVHGVDPAMVTVESSDVGPSGTGAIGLAVDHSRNPLILRSAGGEMTDHPVSARTSVELAGAYAFGQRFEVAAVVPFLSQSGDEPQFSGVAPADGTTLGDVRLRGKVFIGARGPLRFGSSAELTLPTALDTQFAGVEGPSALARGLVDYRRGRLHLAGNVGAIMRERVRMVDVQQGHAVVYGAAAAVQATSRLYGVAELYGTVDVSGGPVGNRPLEAILAGRYRVTREVGVLAGGGRGVLAGIGAPEARLFAAVEWSPGARLLAEPGADPRMLADDDRDGIVNRDDECPRDIEDLDGYRDSDGCPDRDDDRDDVPDLVDACRRESEDADGFQDDDGCPDSDNDGDHVADGRDRCKLVAEDVDGFEDEDGCPDADNDSDGVNDVADRCPSEPETINGNMDEDGCADPGQASVLVGEDRIELREPIRFVGESAAMTRASQRLLGQLAAMLRAHSDIARVRIRAHVHPRGADDDALSVERADIVRRWLIEWGIDADRLEGIGFGSRYQVESGTGSSARAANDRIELEIVERR